MAYVAAWCHLRGCGHRGTDFVERVQDYTTGTVQRKSALKLAMHGRKMLLKQWTEFAEDYRQTRGNRAA